MLIYISDFQLSIHRQCFEHINYISSSITFFLHVGDLGNISINNNPFWSIICLIEILKEKEK